MLGRRSPPVYADVDWTLPSTGGFREWFHGEERHGTVKKCDAYHFFGERLDEWRMQQTS